MAKPKDSHPSQEDDRAGRERLESLRLSKARTLEQLERATNENYRKMLQRTLAALDAEMDELSKALTSGS